MRRHTTIFTSIPAVDTRYPSCEYLHWYRQRTVLYVSNPSHPHPLPEGYQGDDSRECHMAEMVLRMHHMSINHLPDAEPSAAEVWTIMHDMTYDALRGARELSRLSYRPPPMLVHHDEGHIDPRRIHRTPRNVRGSQHCGGRRRRVRAMDQTDYYNTQSYAHYEGPSPSACAFQQYVHDTDPSHACQTYDDGAGPSQLPSNSSPLTPPCYVPVQDFVTFSSHSFADPHTIRVSTTSISTSPVPFIGFSSQAQDVGQEEESQDVPVNVPRRTRRIRRYPGCGTHGTLGAPH